LQTFPTATRDEQNCEDLPARYITADRNKLEVLGHAEVQYSSWGIDTGISGHQTEYEQAMARTTRYVGPLLQACRRL